MKMKIHLTTVVGSYVDVLPHMLNHYRSLGIDSFLVNAHIEQSADPVLDQVIEITGKFGCDLASITVGPWVDGLNSKIYRRTMESRPMDWFILADQDELQVYPRDLRACIEQCEARGYQYIEGAFLDRIAVDGGLPAVEQDRPIEAQFPLGGFISTPILGADPRKIVAAKGRVEIGPGQHHATGQRGCPADQYCIQVHHFKWVAGLVPRLMKRAAFSKRNKESKWKESERFISYHHENNGRIDTTDPRFYISDCAQGYPHWEQAKTMYSLHSEWRNETLR